MLLDSNRISARLRAEIPWSGYESNDSRSPAAETVSRRRTAVLSRLSVVAALASAVADDARRRGASRYEALAGAVLALADPLALPPIETLERCAVIDGWPLIAQLARSRRDDGMRRTAERMAASVVKASGDRRERVARFVDELL